VVHHGTDGGEQMEPRVHPGFGHALEQSCGAAQPSPTNRGSLAAERHVAEIEGHASGFGRSTGLDIGGERPLERIGGFIGLARPPGGLAHQLEIVGRQASVTIGRSECLQRLRPGVAFDSVPAQLERTGRRRSHRCLVVIE
jgi:hypothetical protein